MRKPKGFTLIELLVVISVIVLLMAILLPVVQRVRNQARAVACQANLKQWGTILGLYVEENQGRFPPASGHGHLFIGRSLLGVGKPRLNGNDIIGVGKPRLNGNDIKGILCCPTAVRPRDERQRPDDYRVYDYTFRTWEHSYKGVSFRGSYGFNKYLLRGMFDESNPLPFLLEGIDVFSLRGRANIPTLLDAARLSSFPIDRFSPPPWSGVGGFGGWDTFCINRHNGHVNGLFLDWSVRKIGLKELWTLKWNLQFDTAGPWTKAGGVRPEDWPRWMRKFKDY